MLRFSHSASASGSSSPSWDSPSVTTIISRVASARPPRSGLKASVLPGRRGGVRPIPSPTLILIPTLIPIPTPIPILLPISNPDPIPIPTLIPILTPNPDSIANPKPNSKPNPNPNPDPAPNPNPHLSSHPKSQH